MKQKKSLATICITVCCLALLTLSSFAQSQIPVPKEPPVPCPPHCVDPGPPLYFNTHPIAADYLGVNGEGVIAAFTSELDALVALKPKHIRYPGGTESNTWNWKNPTINNKSSGWTVSLLNDLSERTNSHPLFVLNMYNGSYLLTNPADWAGMNESAKINFIKNELKTDQINMLDSARKLGLNKQYIELGNELYDKTDNDYSDIYGHGKVTNYMNVSQNFITGIKSQVSGVDFKFAAVGVFIFNNTEEETWNSSIFSAIQSGGTLQDANAIIFHTYVPYINNNDPNRIPTPKGCEDINTLDPNFQFQEAYNFINTFHNSVLPSIPTGKEVWLTEYNLTSGYINGQVNIKNAFFGTWSHGLSTALIAMLHIRQEKITKLTFHNWTGVFPAIFRDLGFPVCQTDTTHDTIPIRTAFSASGYTLQMLNNALDGMEGGTVSALNMNRLLSESYSGELGSMENGIYGMKLEKNPQGYYCWQIGGSVYRKYLEQRAVFLNLNDFAITVKTNNLFTSDRGNELTVTQLYVDEDNPDVVNNPLTFINEQNIATVTPVHSTYNTTEQDLALPPYSMTLVSSTPPCPDTRDKKTIIFSPNPAACGLVRGEWDDVDLSVYQNIRLEIRETNTVQLVLSLPLDAISKSAQFSNCSFNIGSHTAQIIADGQVVAQGNLMVVR